MPDLGRLSFNQMTCDPATLSQAIDATALAGLKWIGVWRHKIKDAPPAQYGKQIREAGLRVSGLCRGGMFPALTAEERQRRVDEPAAGHRRVRRHGRQPRDLVGRVPRDGAERGRARVGGIPHHDGRVGNRRHLDDAALEKCHTAPVCEGW